MIGAKACFTTLAATWPAARSWQQDGWTLRDGAGGGKRVSAASAGPDARAADLAALMPAGPLAMLRPEQTALDRDLAALGYTVVDPTLIYAAPVADLAQKPPHVSLFDLWEPLEIMREIWAEGGIGPDRIAVMARAPGPKTAFLARLGDRVVGCGFCAIHDGVAMLHAVEILPAYRRQGAGRTMLTGAAHWAQGQGAEWFTLAVTEANAPARALYEGSGLQAVARYHYRQKLG
ncbi:GNAT family N-acetyltransferase [Roseibaca sp. Y0-43]|uniref:GNAT family N-acetyltransferase n=1 Tax=Roseibaca sp. Y0-43 TaxID=2816854 RepID=UPI001D0C3B73|nr:GNAT family N-acetyltransferase [Roseibaca sp. Y0-43]MCC1480855.1 GNAT family N-acetyltransferase [Roseibaca sp. Y0-43]